MDIIDVINRNLNSSSYKVRIGKNVTEKEIRYGKHCLFCDKPIKATFQLIDISDVDKEGEVVVLQESEWVSFLQRIEKYLGEKFMKDYRLNELNPNND